MKQIIFLKHQERKTFRHSNSHMNNRTDCTVILWSNKTTKPTKTLFYICLLATVSHLLFRIQLQIFPIEHKRSMVWINAYLTTHLLLLIRFFLLYAYRLWSRSVSQIFHTIICYYEAIFDNYLSLLQSYILLALNICRYLQIVHNHNVYLLNRHAIIIVCSLIYFLPLFGHIMAIQFGWTVIKNLPDDVCDLMPVSMTIKIIFLLSSYFIPVTLALMFLSLCFGYIRNIKDIQTEQVMFLRHRYHQRLVKQSCVFYSLWIILWSPNLLVFPFFHKNSTVNTIAQKLNYTNITLDPLMIAALDVRFLQAWRSTGEYIKRYIRQRQRQQSTQTFSIQSSNSLERTVEANTTIV